MLFLFAVIKLSFPFLLGETTYFIFGIDIRWLEGIAALIVILGFLGPVFKKNFFKLIWSFCVRLYKRTTRNILNWLYRDETIDSLIERQKSNIRQQEVTAKIPIISDGFERPLDGEIIKDVECIDPSGMLDRIMGTYVKLNDEVRRSDHSVYYPFTNVRKWTSMRTNRTLDGPASTPEMVALFEQAQQAALRREEAAKADVGGKRYLYWAGELDLQIRNSSNTAEKLVVIENFMHEDAAWRTDPHFFHSKETMENLIRTRHEHYTKVFEKETGKKPISTEVAPPIEPEKQNETGVDSDLMDFLKFIGKGLYNQLLLDQAKQNVEAQLKERIGVTAKRIYVETLLDYFRPRLSEKSSGNEGVFLGYLELKHSEFRKHEEEGKLLQTSTERTAERTVEAYPVKSASALRADFAEIERRYREVTVRVQYTDGHADVLLGQAGLQYIVHDLRNGMTGLMLMNHNAQLIEFKRVFRSLGQVKWELLNKESLDGEAKELFTDINDFYRSSFEAYVYPITRAYEQVRNFDEAKGWKLSDVSFKDITSQSRTRPRIVGQTSNPPQIDLLRLNLGEVFPFGRIRIKIRNPQEISALLFQGLSIKNDNGDTLQYSMDYDIRKLVEPRWVEPGIPFNLILYVKDLRLDKQANRLIHVVANFDEIGDVKSNEETVPPNKISD